MPGLTHDLRKAMPSDPAAIVQKQLDAYNARDVGALLDIYAEDAQLFEHPSTLIASGREELRQRFTARFAEPNLYAALLSRIVAGRHVIDHEKVTRMFPEGPGEVEVVMIYELSAGHITRSWSIPGAKTLHSLQ